MIRDYCCRLLFVSSYRHQPVAIYHLHCQHHAFYNNCDCSLGADVAHFCSTAQNVVRLDDDAASIIPTT